MRRILLAAVALGGLTVLASSGASAAPSAAGVHAVQQPQPHVTNVDYYWHHQHYHHRHWQHHQWHYYN